jgi:hypothetical protein
VVLIGSERVTLLCRAHLQLGDLSGLRRGWKGRGRVRAKAPDFVGHDRQSGTVRRGVMHGHGKAPDAAARRQHGTSEREVALSEGPLGQRLHQSVGRQFEVVVFGNVLVHEQGAFTDD